MKTRYHILSLAILIFLTGCQISPAQKQIKFDLESARTNFEQKNYETSMQILRPLAAEGVADAQYAIGYQYFYGLGVEQNTQAGTEWIRLAAQQQYVPAQEALAKINELKQTFEPIDELVDQTDS